MSPEYKYIITADLESEADAKDLGLIVRKLHGVEEVEILLPLESENPRKNGHTVNRRWSKGQAEELLENVDELNVGQLSKALRISRGLKRDDVIKTGGLSSKSISFIERNLLGGDIGMSAINKYADGLGLAPEDPLRRTLIKKAETQRGRLS